MPQTNNQTNCQVKNHEDAMSDGFGRLMVEVESFGVPYILVVGLWALAAGSAFTFGQRVHAVYRAAKAPAEPGS